MVRSPTVTLNLISPDLGMSLEHRSWISEWVSLSLHTLKHLTLSLGFSYRYFQVPAQFWVHSSHTTFFNRQQSTLVSPGLGLVRKIRVWRYYPIPHPTFYPNSSRFAQWTYLWVILCPNFSMLKCLGIYIFILCPAFYMLILCPALYIFILCPAFYMLILCPAFYM